MSYIYYCYMGLIPPNSEATLEQLRDRLSNHYGKHNRTHTLELRDSHLRFKIQDYTFDIHYVAAPHVREESGEMAKYYKGDDQAAKLEIQNCPARFEMSGDDDPNLDYFNDSIMIQEAMEALGIILIFDPFRGTFTNQY
jgi:hypothetical protein